MSDETQMIHDGAGLVPMPDGPHESIGIVWEHPTRLGDCRKCGKRWPCPDAEDGDDE